MKLYQRLTGLGGISFFHLATSCVKINPIKILAYVILYDL